MIYEREEERIINKIIARKTFQTETWNKLDFIFDILVNSGFHKLWDFAAHNSNSVGWEYYFINNEKYLVRVLVCDFLGRYIQVEFQKTWG